MKDVQAEIRKGYYNRLNGAISSGVYDTLAPNGSTAKKYVILSTQTDIEASTKETFISDCTMLVDVVVRSTQPTGRKECDDIAAEVIDLIIPSKRACNNIEAEGFQVVETKKVSNDSFYTLSGTENVYRRLIRFQHKVVEK